MTPGGEEVTFGSLLAHAERVAGSLRAAAVASTRTDGDDPDGDDPDTHAGDDDVDVLRGARVAVSAVPGAEFVAAVHAAWMCGAIAVPIARGHSLDETAYVLKDAGVAVFALVPESREPEEPESREPELRVFARRRLRGRRDGRRASIGFCGKESRRGRGRARGGARGHGGGGDARDGPRASGAEKRICFASVARRRRDGEGKKPRLLDSRLGRSRLGRETRLGIEESDHQSDGRCSDNLHERYHRFAQGRAAHARVALRAVRVSVRGVGVASRRPRVSLSSSAPHPRNRQRVAVRALRRGVRRVRAHHASRVRAAHNLEPTARRHGRLEAARHGLHGRADDVTP